MKKERERILSLRTVMLDIAINSMNDSTLRQFCRNLMEYIEQKVP